MPVLLALENCHNGVVTLANMSDAPVAYVLSLWTLCHAAIKQQHCDGIAECVFLSFGQVGLLDIDICGPSVPKMLGLEGQEVHQSALGWSPVYVEENLAVMSIGEARTRFKGA